MGLCKLVYTWEKNGSEAINPEDRAAARTLIARRDCVRQFERERAIEAARLEASVITTAYLQLGYVGITPSVAGAYLVVDTDTNGVQYVTLDGRMCVRDTCSNASIPLGRYNMASFRWFLLGKLDPADVAGLQKLPTMKE